MERQKIVERIHAEAVRQAEAAAKLAEQRGEKASYFRPDRRVFTGTWLDRPGQQFAIRFQSKQTGKRVVVHAFDESDHVNVRIVEGDGRDPENFKTYADQDFAPDVVPAEVLLWIGHETHNLGI